MKENDRALLQSLGFDSRFKYPNVKINSKYHIVQVPRPMKSIHSFIPSKEQGYGVPGSNHTSRAFLSHHMLVNTGEPVSSFNGVNVARFSSLDRYDKPHTKHAVNLSKDENAALYK